MDKSEKIKKNDYLTSCAPIPPEILHRLSMFFLMDEVPVMDEKGEIKHMFVTKDRK